MILDKTGITTYKVASALGTNTRNISALCVSPSINPWSKCKPVNLNNPTPNRNGDWWKGDNGRCGFTIGVKDSNGAIHNVTNLDDMPQAKWYYDTVTKSNPKRLADFGGYNTEATPCLFSRIDSDMIKINKSKGDYHEFEFDIIPAGDDYNLGVDSFNFLNDYYFAAAIKGPATFGHWREFRGDPISNGSGGVRVKVGDLTDGVYDCILFGSTSNNPDLDGDMIPLPSDSLNRTSFQFRISMIFSFDIVLNYVSRSIDGPWTLIDDIPWYDEETGSGGYKCPYSGRLFFKGYTIRTNGGFDRVNDMDMKGESESFHGGMYKTGLGSCVYDLSGKLKHQLTTPGSNVGDTEGLIIKWDGYVGETEPEEPQPIGGGLSVYNKTAYLGGSADFDLYM